MASKLTRLFLSLCVTLPLFSKICTILAENQPGGTLSDILSPLVDLLECDKGRTEIQRICELISTPIKSSLGAAHMSISKDGMVYRYDNQENKSIDTGHDCFTKARINRQRARVKLDASARIDFSGNPLSGAGAVVIRLPIDFSVEVNCEQRSGVKCPLDNCQILATDGFDVSGSIDTTADIAVFLALAPSLKRNENGDFVLTIKPILDVSAQLENTKVDAHISGKNPISSIISIALAFPAAATKFFIDYITLDTRGQWEAIGQELALGWLWAS